jgi:alpha/beta superfamily hydrolase
VAPASGTSGTSGTRIVPVTIAGPAGELEGLVNEHVGRIARVAALVCHPHPLYGGTLHNKVVHRAATAVHRLGAAAVRFNFRGVGKSAGTFDQGAGELDDARAVLAWAAARYPHARLWMCGFSFGSWVAAQLAASNTAVERVVLIAPPVRTHNFEALRSAHVPKLVVQGTADEVCPPAALEREYPSWSEPKQLVLVDGASHFFDRRLTQLGEALAHALAPVAPPD